MALKYYFNSLFSVIENTLLNHYFNPNQLAEFLIKCIIAA